jgi:CO/xanthine dehydrogenase Mo-binding subunit
MKERRSYSNASSRHPEGFSLTRRQFLKGLGGGIIILFSWESLPAQERRLVGTPGLPTDFNAFVRIAPDGRVSCFTGKIEMGQGIVTSVAQILAEEMDVPLASIDMIMGDTDLCPWDMGTFGSRTTRFFGPPLREAAAEARTILIELASERLGVDKGQLFIKNGVVIDRNNSKRQVRYGQLAQERQSNGT